MRGSLIAIESTTNPARNSPEQRKNRPASLGPVWLACVLALNLAGCSLKIGSAKLELGMDSDEKKSEEKRQDSDSGSDAADSEPLAKRYRSAFFAEQRENANRLFPKRG